VRQRVLTREETIIGVEPCPDARPIASVSRCDPSRRASAAGTASSKKTQTWQRSSANTVELRLVQPTSAGRAHQWPTPPWGRKPGDVTVFSSSIQCGSVRFCCILVQNVCVCLTSLVPEHHLIYRLLARD
jgi:hypothetical protein